jgi:hypothetical protein
VEAELPRSAQNRGGECCAEPLAAVAEPSAGGHANGRLMRVSVRLAERQSTTELTRPRVPAYAGFPVLAYAIIDVSQIYSRFRW